MCVCIISFRQVLALVLNDLLTTDSEHWIETSKSVVTWNIIIWKEKIKPQSCKSPLNHKIYSLLSCSWLQVKMYIVEIKEYVMFHITCFSIGLCFQRSFPYFYIVLECVNSNGILLTIKFTYCDLLIDLIISKYLGHLSSLAIRHSLVLAIFINVFSWVIPLFYIIDISMWHRGKDIGHSIQRIGLSFDLPHTGWGSSKTHLIYLGHLENVSNRNNYTCSINITRCGLESCKNLQLWLLPINSLGYLFIGIFYI